MNQQASRPQGRPAEERRQEKRRPPAREGQRQAKKRIGAYEKRFRKIYGGLVAFFLVVIVILTFMVRGRLTDILGKNDPTEPPDFEVFPYYTLPASEDTEVTLEETDLTNDFTLPDSWATVNPVPTTVVSVPRPTTSVTPDPGTSSTSSEEKTATLPGESETEGDESQATEGPQETETQGTPAESTSLPAETENPTAPPQEDEGGPQPDDSIAAYRLYKL